MGRLGRWGGGHNRGSLQVRGGERKQQGVIAGEGRGGGGEVDTAGGSQQVMCVCGGGGGGGHRWGSQHVRGRGGGQGDGHSRGHNR